MDFKAEHALDFFTQQKICFIYLAYRQAIRDDYDAYRYVAVSSAAIAGYGAHPNSFDRTISISKDIMGKVNIVQFKS